MKTPTSIFPAVSRLYPNSQILGIRKAFKNGKGWINQNETTNLLAQIRTLRKEGYNKVLLVIKYNGTKQPIESDFSIQELIFYTPLTQLQYENSKGVRL